MKITPEKVQELAHLARLEFEGEAAENIRRDLENILEMCETLNNLDTEGIAPLIYMTDNVNVLRDDLVHQDISHEDAVKNSPAKDSEYFRVPMVIDQPR